MNKIFTVFMILIAVSFLYVETGVAGDPMEQAKAQWDKMQADNYQETWALFPGTDKFYKGTEPHGMLLTTYVNKTANDALKSGAKELPKGSMLIKENYMPDKKLGAITTMHKTGDGKDDWFWVKYNPDGSLAKMGDMALAGQPGGCVGCHATSTSGIHNIMTGLPE
jgi:Cytochrome P460